MEPFEAVGRRQPVDASIFAPGFSAELVTTGEVESLYKSAEILLKATGEDSSINGVPALVSSIYEPVTINIQHGEKKEALACYARIFQLYNQKGQEPELPGIVFDSTTDLTVATRNIFAIRFKQWPNGSYYLMFDTNEVEPVINTAAHVNKVAEILAGLNHTFVASEAEKRAQEAQARRERAAVRVRRNRGIRKVSRRVAVMAFYGVAGFSAAFGLIKGLGAVIPEDFDTRELTLSGGTELAVGETGTPAFASELFDDSFSSPTVPNLEEDGKDPDNSMANPDEELNADNLFRDVWLRSSKPEHEDNCQNVAIEPIPENMRLVAWTDFDSPDGTSRANELVIRHDEDSFIVCWYGQELGDDDDARVVVTLRPVTELQVDND